MGYVSTVGMGKRDWLELRKTGIGASEVGAILGLSKWATPLDIYNDKISPEIKEFDSQKMRAGREMETVIAKMWAEDNGFAVKADNKNRFHDEYPFLRASLDRTIVAKDDRGPGICEIKNTSAFKLWDGGEMPLMYYAQVQHQLFVTGYSWGVLAVLLNGWKIESELIEYSPEFYEGKALPILIDFWGKVQKKIPPDPATYKEASDTSPLANRGEEVEASDVMFNAFAELMEVQDKAKELEEKEEALKLEIAKGFGTAEIMMRNGTKIGSYKTGKGRSSIDWDKLNSEHPGFMDEYRIPGGMTR